MGRKWELEPVRTWGRAGMGKLANSAGFRVPLPGGLAIGRQAPQVQAARHSGEEDVLASRPRPVAFSQPETRQGRRSALGAGGVHPPDDSRQRHVGKRRGAFGRGENQRLAHQQCQPGYVLWLRGSAGRQHVRRGQAIDPPPWGPPPVTPPPPAPAVPFAAGAAGAHYLRLRQQ